MTSIEKIYGSMFSQVYHLLIELNPNMNKSDWKSIFTHTWEKENDHCGYDKKTAIVI